MEEVYQELEKFQELLRTHQPQVYEETQRLYDATLDYLKNYEERIFQKIQKEAIRNAARIKIENESDFSSAFKNFLNNLAKYGKIKITNQAYVIIGNRQKVNGKGRYKGIFLDNNLLGMLSLYDNKSFWYEGLYPEKKFVRLIYDDNKTANKKDDNWNIPFP